MWWLDAYDLLVGAVWGMYLARKHLPPVPVTTKVTLRSDPDELPEPPNSYVTGYAPIINKLEVAAKFGDAIRFNAVGAQALSNIIKDLSTKMDRAVKIALANQPDYDPNVKKFDENVTVQKQARVGKSAK